MFDPSVKILSGVPRSPLSSEPRHGMNSCPGSCRIEYGGLHLPSGFLDPIRGEYFFKSSLRLNSVYAELQGVYIPSGASHTRAPRLHFLLLAFLAIRIATRLRDLLARKSI